MKVLSRAVTEGKRRFKGAVTRVKLDIEIPRLYTVDPNGPQLFGEDIIKIIKNNVPSGISHSNCRVGIMLESDEISEVIGLSFKPLNKLSSEDIVQSMEEMSQSNKSVLELDTPKLALRITYLNPPSGSGGKRKFDIASLLDLTAFGKRSKRDKERGEEQVASDLFDAAAKDTDGSEEDEETEAEELEDEVIRPQRSNIMKNDGNF